MSLLHRRTWTHDCSSYRQRTTPQELFARSTSPRRSSRALSARRAARTSRPITSPARLSRRSARSRRSATLRLRPESAHENEHRGKWKRKVLQPYLTSFPSLRYPYRSRIRKSFVGSRPGFTPVAYQLLVRARFRCAHYNFVNVNTILSTCWTDTLITP